MSSSDSFSIEILNNVFVYINRYVLPVLFIMGNIGNILSALIFFKKVWRKNVCVFYFLICLFINSCYMISGMLGAIFTVGLNINVENSNVVICKVLYYVSYVFSVLLPTVLILASIDRLLISSQNIDTRLYSSRRLAYFSVSICTFFWVVYYIHILVKTNIYEFYPSVFICYYEMSGLYYQFLWYSNAIINLMLSVAILIMSILTFKNVRRIRSVPRQQRHQLRTMNKKDFQLLRCLYVHDIVYIIFISFPSVYGIYQAATNDYIKTPLQRAIEGFFLNFGTFIHHIPYCACFFIFISVSKAFRLEIKRLAYKICGKHLLPIREEENIQQNDDKNNIELNVVSTIQLPIGSLNK